jgi:Baseplate J-like protein
MPINLPNLDDRTFADLVMEAQALIPVHAPEWTNHNEADPGITFIELFAYLTEILIYRLNRVTDANVCAFLKLIDGIERTPSTQHSGMITRGELQSEVALKDEVRTVVLQLRQQDRAITCEDFERLALSAAPQVERAYCVPLRDLTSATPYAKADAHVSVVIYPGEAEMKESVSDYLEPRRLLTTRVHVVGPRFVIIGVHITLNLKPDAKGEDVIKIAVDRLSGFFSPAGGGPDGSGWPFGRPVYVSEIYRLLNNIPGVDFVTKAIDAKSGKPFEIFTVYDSDDDTARDTSIDRRITFPEGNAQGELVAISLHPDELVQFSIKKSVVEYEQAARKDDSASNQ